MTPLSTFRSNSSIPLTWRTLLLATAFFACLLLNADYARGQTPPDDHGNTVLTATPIDFGSSVDGRIDPADDVDIFTFDLRDQTSPIDVWIYSTGELDSVGLLFDSDLDNIAWGNNTLYYGQGRLSGFNIRVALQPDFYVLLVESRRNLTVGDYTLHVVEDPADPSDSIDSPTQLDIDSPIPGAIRQRGRSQYFKLDVTEPSSLVIQAENAVFEWREELHPLAPLVARVFDEQGEEVPVNIYGLSIRTSEDDVEPLGFIIEDDFAPGAYLLELTTPSDRLATEYPVFYTVQMVEDAYYKSFRDYCKAQTEALEDTTIDDPFYACQWHLDQPSGEDINVKPVWDEGLMGEGINIAVVDDGMDWTHEDLIDNVNPDLNHDYTGEGNVHHPFEHHGTAVAGIIAARDNDIGVRGVAPRATIYGYNMLNAPAETESAEDLIVSDAAGRNAGLTAVSNNSWGFVDSPALPPAIWELAVESAVTRGYDDKGIFYVWSAGNGHDDGDNSNLNGIANFYAVTAVCAVNEAGTRSWYSEMGANLWLCGPSSHPRTEERYRGTVTTENSDRYRDDFGGTSSAAPAVSGVAALVRQANPDLTWRDVKLILADSARKNDPDNTGWEEGARTYGSTSESDRYHFNHEYGFGVVDAAAAVEMARTWNNLPPMREESVHSSKIDRLIPEAYDAASIETVSLTLTLDLDTDLDFTEFVQIDASFQHNSFRDLDIELISPSGKVSKLVPAYDTFTDDNDPDNDYVPLRDSFRFGSARHLGEDPNGTWTLSITDRFRFGTGNLESWGVTVYGHSFTEVDNVAPVFADGETTSRSVVENTPAGDPVGAPVAAADVHELTYTLGGPDLALFDIDSATGQISVGAGTSLDYEVRPDYAVTVTATDPSGATDTITVNIAVTDVSLGVLGDRYDADHNEEITREEVIQAILDFLDDLITRNDVLEIINLFIFG